MNRVCLIALLVLIAAGPAPDAQTSMPPSAPPQVNAFTSSLKPRWENIKRLLSESAAKVPEPIYSFRPTADVRTFGQIVGHLANDQYLICSAARVEKNPNPTDFEKVTSKDELIKALAAAHVYCDPLYAMSDAETLMELDLFGEKGSRFGAMLLNVTHDSEHYGNLVTYMRLNKIVPPSTQSGR